MASPAARYLFLKDVDKGPLAQGQRGAPLPPKGLRNRPCRWRSNIVDGSLYVAEAGPL